MLTDKVESIATVKVYTVFSPAAEDYPHYRLISVQTRAGNDMRLLSYIDSERYLLLESRIRRYLAVKKLAWLTEKVPFKVSEVMREAERVRLTSPKRWRHTANAMRKPLDSISGTARLWPAGRVATIA